MRLNNYQSDDPTYYSYVEYRNIDSTVVEKEIDQNWVLVRSSIGGLFLSLISDSLVLPFSVYSMVTLALLL